jgi:exopolysaccharide biosynthesis polyprenyl glycosylphosphotransferase
MSDLHRTERVGLAHAVPVRNGLDVVARSRSRAGRVLPEWLLGAGTWPLLLGADLVAMSVAAVVLRYVTTEAGWFTVSFVCLLAVAGLYRSRLSISVLDDLPRIIGSALCACAVAAVIDSLVGWGGLGYEAVERELLVFAGFACACAILARCTTYALVRHMRKAGIAHDTLILGAGRIGGQVAATLADHPEYGLRPVGFLDSDPLLQAADHGLPVFGAQRDLAVVLAREQVRVVVVAFAAGSEDATVDIIRACDRMQCEIFIVPRLFEVSHVTSDMDYTWGVPLVRLRRAPYRTKTWRLKRVMDATLSALALAALAPLMAVVGLLVRAEGGPGILFRQERIGVDGRSFQLLKFRSMKPVDSDESATQWNISQDSRVGPVGRFLRKSSIDELPQLVNILRGEMSIVGPRPERPHFVEEFGRLYPRYVARHRVPSGLTGWSQIHGLRGDTSIEARARFDNYYIENWSLWLDVKIIARTLISVFNRSGA